MAFSPALAIYDACILYPFHLRNVVVQAAVDGLVDARWTDAIHDEWMRNLLTNTPGLLAEHLAATKQLMDVALPEATITGYEKHIQTVKLPDPDDRHVVAAAIEAGALMIVTWNLRDFPVSELRKHGLVRQSPDAFLAGLYAQAPHMLIGSLANGLPASTLDMSRVEILRGPQGTLWGRNSQGGAINLVPNIPDFTPSYSLRGEVGSNGWGLGELIANTPLIPDKLAGRLAIQYNNRDGDITNITAGGKDGAAQVGAVRGSLLYTPDASTSALLTFNYNRDDDTNPYRILRNSFCFPCSATDPRADFTRQGYGANLRFEHEFDSFKFTSLSSINRTDVHQLLDNTDGLVFGAILNQPPSAFADPTKNLLTYNLGDTEYYQEFRASSLPGEPVLWTAGVNFFRSEFSTDSNGSNVDQFSLRPFSGQQHNNLTSNSYAAFGETTVPIVGNLKGTVGLRLTHEDKTANYNFLTGGFPTTVPSFAEKGSFSDTFLTGKVGLSYDWSPNFMTYVNVGRGAVAGGFPYLSENIPLGQLEKAFPTSFSWSYEAGFKSTLWDDRVTLNGAVFYNDVSKGHIIAFGTGGIAFQTDVLDYHTFGGELEARVQVTPDFSVGGGFGYTQAEFQNVPLGGTTGAVNGGDVPNVPHYTGNLTAEYRVPAQSIGLPDGSVFINGTYQYVGSRAADVPNSFRLNPYNIINTRIGWDGINLNGRSLSVYAFANNLLDDRYEALGQPASGVQEVIVGPGRIVGVGASIKF